MLSDEVVDKVLERLVERIEQGNRYVLEKMGASIKKIGTLSPIEAQKVVQMLKYGGDYEEIVRELSKITDLNVKDIKDIFHEIAKNDYNFAKQFYKYRNKSFIPYEQNTLLVSKVEALSNMAIGNYLNLTGTSAVGFGWQGLDGTITFKGLKQTYYDLLDEAVFNVSQGKETFNEAMYRQLKMLGGSGVKTIYPSTYITYDENGNEIIKNRVMRLDSAIRMQMKDALRKLHNEEQLMIGEEIDADGVEVSVHLNPAPDHALVQGRQFDNDEFEKFQNDQDAKDVTGMLFPAISGETGHDRRAIGQYNCYHYIFSIVIGVNKPQYTGEQLQEIIDKNERGFEFEGQHYTNYEGTQLQRRLETEIRKQKDTQILAKASGNKKLIAEAQQKITNLTQKYKELSDISGLGTKMDRMRVVGYRRTSVK